MAKELQKLGKNLELKGIVIHQVIKDAGAHKVTTKAAKTSLKIEQKERSFIAQINKSYFEKSSPTYGIFANEHPDFKTELTNYLANDDFFTFTKNVLGIYKSVLANTVSATGGFLIFAHFYNKEKKFDYMLVMTTNNKDGYFVSDDLEIKDIKNLDLSKVDVACIINLTKWQEIEAGKDTESKTYLSFAKGNKNVSYYFLTFIDCDNKTTSTESTNKMKRALEDYCNATFSEREEKIRMKNAVYSYCIGCMDEKREIQLSSISAILNPEDPFAFTEFASSEDYGVNPIINGDRSKIKTMKFVKYKDKTMAIEFDCELLTDKVVVFDKVKKQLTIKKLPQALIDQIPS